MMTPKEIIDFLSKVKFDEKGLTINVEVWVETKRESRWMKMRRELNNIFERLGRGEDLRIIPEKRYEPYKEVNPEWINKLVMTKNKKYKFMIINFNFYTNEVKIGEEYFHLKEAFDNYTWADGSIFGRLIDE